MKILFATGHGYMPQRVGGCETSSHELILTLQERGHRCAVLARLQGNGWLALRNRMVMKLARCSLVVNSLPGYRVQRAWYPDRHAVTAVAREYWNDPRVYEAASAAALNYARRPEIDPARQISSLEVVLQTVASGAARAPLPPVRLAG